MDRKPDGTPMDYEIWTTRAVVVWLGICALLALLVTGAGAWQAPAPTLTDLEKARLTIAWMRLELATERVKDAEQERDAAGNALADLMTALRREGYDLDPKLGAYRPVPRERR